MHIASRMPGEFRKPNILNLFFERNPPSLPHPALQFVYNRNQLPRRSPARIVDQVGVVIRHFRVPPRFIPFAPTCSRNHADGTFPSITTVAGILGDNFGRQLRKQKVFERYSSSSAFSSSADTCGFWWSECDPRASAPATPPHRPLPFRACAERITHCLLLLKILSR